MLYSLNPGGFFTLLCLIPFICVHTTTPVSPGKSLWRHMWVQRGRAGSVSSSSCCSRAASRTEQHQPKNRHPPNTAVEKYQTAIRLRTFFVFKVITVNCFSIPHRTKVELYHRVPWGRTSLPLGRALIFTDALLVDL